MKRSLKAILFLGMLFLWGCSAEKQYVREEQPPLPVPLYPFPLKGNSILSELIVGCEKTGIVIEANMWRQTSSDLGRMYILKVRITNLRPSILMVNTDKIFARETKGSTFLKTLTGEKILGFIRDRASQDYARYQWDKLNYDTFMRDSLVHEQGGLFILGYILSKKKEKEFKRDLESYLPLKDFAEKEMLFSSQLPREGSAEGYVLFIQQNYLLGEEDDLIVQLYLGGEEFVFRFVEATKIPSPDLELINIPPPEEL